MKIHSLLLMAIIAITYSCSDDKPTATFRYFSYSGMDGTFALSADTANTIRNPVLSGFYPDPSICRMGKQSLRTQISSPLPA